MRTQDVRETSLLLVFFTRDFGKVRGLIKGVRGPRGPLGDPIQIFSLNRVVFYTPRRSGIHTVSQCDLVDFYESIRGDIVKTGYACYYVELVDALTQDKDTNEEIFDLLLAALELLKGDSSIKRVSRIFEIRLLALSGLMPGMDRCVMCGKSVGPGKDAYKGVKFSYKSGGLLCEKCVEKDRSARRIMAGTVHFIEHVRRAPYEQLERIKVSRDVGAELEDIMKKFISYQLDKEIRSLAFLEYIKD